MDYTTLMSMVVGMVIGFLLSLRDKAPKPKRRRSSTLRQNGNPLRFYRFEENLSRNIPPSRNRKS